jgi:hypothetical protein
MSHPVYIAYECIYIYKVGGSLSSKFKKSRKVVPYRYTDFNQYSENNVMNVLFNLLRIMGLYMFRALLAHPQEALHKRHLVYCVRVMSVGCY